MKKRKILVLFPLLGLLLSGCTFQEGLTTTKDWISDHIIQPIKNLFNKDKKSDDSKGGGDDSGKKAEVNYGTEESPLTLTQFQTEIEKVIDYSTVAEGTTITYKDKPFYVKGTVKTNKALGEKSAGQYEYVNLYDSANESAEVTGYCLSAASSVDSSVYSAADSMKGCEVVVKGYGMLFNKTGKGKIYEIGNQAKDEGEKGYIIKVTEPGGTPGVNYGSLTSPLTVSEAKALIDSENPTGKKIFVTGEVKSNDAYNSQYSNVLRITITDNTNDLVIYKCGTFPSDFDATSLQENKMKGKTVVASGIGEIYESTTYEITGPQIHSIEGEDLPPVVIDDYGSLESPLSISAAKAVIDLQDPTEQDLYVTGVVKSNKKWDTGYNNIEITLTDGANDFVLYRASTLPGGATPDEGAWVGKVVIAHGKGKNHQGTYELDSGCTVDSVEDAVVSSVAISGTPSQTEYGVGQNYSHAGLVATATLSGGVQIDVSEKATWTPSKVSAEAGDQSVSFTASYGGETSPSFSFGITISDAPVLVETEIYKLDGTATGGSSGYGEASSITQGTLSWSVVANTTMNPWRFGGKGAQVRNCESTTAVSADDVTKVVVTTGTATATVNSITLKVGTSQGSGDISEISKTSGLTSATLEFARPANTSWASRYFTIVFDVTCADGSNQYVQLKSAQFYAMK